jgi:hypothetical protein
METRTLSWIRNGAFFMALATLIFVYFFAGKMLQTRGFTDVSTAWLMLQAHSLLVSQSGNWLAALLTWPWIPYLLIVLMYPIAGSFTPVILAGGGLAATLYVVVRHMLPSTSALLKLAVFALFAAHPAMIFLAVSGVSNWLLVPAFPVLLYYLHAWLDHETSDEPNHTSWSLLRRASLVLTLMLFTNIWMAGIVALILPVVWLRAVQVPLSPFAGFLGSLTGPAEHFRRRTGLVLQNFLMYPTGGLLIYLLLNTLLGGNGITGLSAASGDVSAVVWTVLTLVPFTAVLLMAGLRDFRKVWLIGSPAMIFLLVGLSRDVTELAPVTVAMVGLGTIVFLPHIKGLFAVTEAGVSGTIAGIVAMVSTQGRALAMFVAVLISLHFGYRFLPALDASSGMKLAWTTFQMKQSNHLITTRDENTTFTDPFFDESSASADSLVRLESLAPRDTTQPTETDTTLTLEAADALIPAPNVAQSSGTVAQSSGTVAAQMGPNLSVRNPSGGSSITWQDTSRYYMEVRIATNTGASTLRNEQELRERHGAVTLMPEYREGLRVRWLIGTGRYATFRAGVEQLERERGSAGQAWIVLHHRTDFRVFGPSPDLDRNLPMVRIRLGTFSAEGDALAAQAAWSAVGMNQTEIVRNGARVELLTGAYNDRENAALLARYIREKSGIRADVISD